jgi:transposase
MQILYSRCCGIDVHKDAVTACVLVYSDSPEPEVRKKEFATYLKALLNLKMWLLAQKVTHVAMESTGVYWKPVWQALEGSFGLILANPFQVKGVPGRKSATGFTTAFTRCLKMPASSRTQLPATSSAPVGEPSSGQ